MPHFAKQLTEFLDNALRQNVIDHSVRDRLERFAGEQNRSRGVLNLATVLGGLGGVIFALGVVLLISANWQDIHDNVKLLGFFLLFAGTHTAGIYLRQRTSSVWFPEALNLIGAILFIAGVGLISQIYHVELTPVAVLTWLLAIAPLAWCFRSASISLVAVFAFALWLHLEQSHRAPRAASLSYTAALMIEVGLGTGLIGFAALLRECEPRIARTFRGCGLMLLFYSGYMMGFYRHFFHEISENSIALIPSWAALGFGAVGLACGYRAMLPDHAVLKNRLTVFLGLLQVTVVAMLLVEAGILPKGPDLQFFNFGWYRTFHAMEWLLSIAAWVLWFALALWCVFFAARTGRQNYLNAGVVAVGLGVVTRFFDLMGELFETGLAFVIGGGVLLITCFVAERWRRNVVSTFAEQDRQKMEGTES